MSQHVFLIDDDPRVRTAVGTLLRLLGYAVHAFGDEQDFLTQLDPTVRGCAIVDYRLARGNGLQLIRQLRERNERIVPILVSGHADESVRDAAIAEGISEILAKPFENDELRDAIDRCLRQAEALA